jgi:hypothetical protein
MAVAIGMIERRAGGLVQAPSRPPAADVAYRLEEGRQRPLLRVLTGEWRWYRRRRPGRRQKAVGEVVASMIRPHTSQGDLPT